MSAHTVKLIYAGHWATSSCWSGLGMADGPGPRKWFGAWAQLWAAAWRPEACLDSVAVQPAGNTIHTQYKAPYIDVDTRIEASKTLKAGNHFAIDTLPTL